MLLSNNVQGAKIVGNEFVYTGDSAVVSVGTSEGIVGTAQTFLTRLVKTEPEL